MLYRREDFIKEWCSKNCINSENMIEILKKYARLRNQIFKTDNDMIETESDIDSTFEWFDKNLSHYKEIIEDKNVALNRALLHGYGTKLIKNIEGTPYYMHVANPSPEFVGSLAVANVFVGQDTFLNKICRGRYLIYFTVNIFTDALCIAQHVEPEDVQKVVPYVYSPYNMYRTMNLKTYYQDMLNGTLRSIGKEKAKPILKRYVMTIKNARQDMLNNYDRNIWNRMKEVCSDTFEHKDMYNSIIDQIKDINERYLNKDIHIGGGQIDASKISEFSNYIISAQLN